MVKLDERVLTYRLAIRKASAWLASAQLPDGSYGPDAGALGDLETAAICLNLTGYPKHAGRLLQHIKRTLFRADGTFNQPDDEGTLSEWPYAPSWTVVSAHQNGSFEVSFPAMAQVLRFQDSQTGGLFGHPRAQEAGAGVIVLTVTAVAGTAAIVTGQIGAARRMGDYFLNLIALQPDLENCFYPYYDTRYGLVTGGVPELAPSYLGTFERKVPKQHYWVPGFLMAFLSDLYLATGEGKYLDGARAMFEFSTGCAEDLFSNTLNHKYLWGCARLYRATGDPRCLEAALRVADFLVSIQEPEGTWWHSGFIPRREDQALGWTVDMSSQFCIWLIRLLQVI